MFGHTKQKSVKNGQKGAWPGSRDLLFKFWDPPNISGTAKARNLKFCMQIDVRAYQTKNEKNDQKWEWPGSRDLLLKLWDALIYLEPLKVET